MSREQLIKKHPTLFIECIKEGIELCMHGHTDIFSVEDVEEANEKIREREEFWERMSKDENELVNSLI